MTLKRSEVGNCVTADTLLLKALGRLGSVAVDYRQVTASGAVDALAAVAAFVPLTGREDGSWLGVGLITADESIRSVDWCLQARPAAVGRALRPQPAASGAGRGGAALIEVLRVIRQGSTTA
jgi:hypothetical protein